MEQLQETALGDVLKIIDAFGKVLKTKGENKNDTFWKILKGGTTKSQYKGSITSRANKLCMTFPVLCSNTITPSTASMISKAIESKCLLMVQQIFAADMIIANANTGGILNKINDIYTGIDFDSLSVDDLIEITSKVDPKNKLFESANIYSNEMVDLYKKIMSTPIYESSVNESSISSYMVDSKYGSIKEDPDMLLSEAPRVSKSNKDLIDEELLNAIYNTSVGNKEYAELAKAIDSYRNDYNIKDLENLLRLSKEIRDRVSNTRDDVEFRQRLDNMMQSFAYTKEKNARENRADKRAESKEKRDIEELKYKRAKETRDAEKHQWDKEKNKRDIKIQNRQDLLAGADLFKKQLMDTDVKKANELVPSMLVTNYGLTTKEGETLTNSAIVGIKCRLIPLDSFQILDKLASKNNDKSGFVKFLRATSGEIKFVKDFVLAIDKAKIDALNRSKRGSADPIWRVLERRAAVDNLRKALGQKNNMSPITTLVITQEEVDYLKKISNMELDNVGTANYIMNAFNLMGICIVDETMETAKFLFDGEFNQFDTYAFNTLQKENRESNGEMKKVINLMAKRM